LGDDLDYIIRHIKLKRAKIVFLGVSDLHILGDMDRYATGVFRSVSSAKLVKINKDIIQNNDRPVFLFKQNSRLHRMSSTIQKKAKKRGVTLDLMPYESPAQFDRLVQQLKERGNTSILLFPPSVSSSDLPLLIKAQYKYRLPILAQRASHVQMGALGGNVLDYDAIIPLLVNKIKRLMAGEDIANLPNDFVMPKYIINQTVRRYLDIAIDETNLQNTKIIHTRLVKKDIEVSKKPIDGNFTIYVDNKVPRMMLKRYRRALKKEGLLEHQNLTFSAHSPSSSDIIFTTSNLFQHSITQSADLPIVAITHHESLENLNFKNRNFVVAPQLPFRAMSRHIKNLGYKKVGLVCLKEDFDPLVYDQVKAAFKLDQIETTWQPYDAAILDKFKRERVDLMLILPCMVDNISVVEGLVALQLSEGIPVFSELSYHLQHGVLYAMDSEVDHKFDYLAKTTRQILQGTPPQDIDHYVNNRSTLMINLPAAIRLKKNFSKSILKEAILYTGEEQ
jgi:ABC-type uncharacterized transport system substrate-binding protein